MTSGVHDTPALLRTLSWGPGRGWEEGRQVVDQATEQIKLLLVWGAWAALSAWAGGCSRHPGHPGHPGSASCPCSASLRGKELFASPLAAAGTAGRSPCPPKSWFAKRPPEPGGEMKGWPANHIEVSFARTRLGLGPALPLSEPFLQAVVL